MQTERNWKFKVFSDQSIQKRKLSLVFFFLEMNHIFFLSFSWATRLKSVSVLYVPFSSDDSAFVNFSKKLSDDTQKTHKGRIVFLYRFVMMTSSLSSEERDLYGFLLLDLDTLLSFRSDQLLLVWDSGFPGNSTRWSNCQKCQPVDWCQFGLLLPSIACTHSIQTKQNRKNKLYSTKITFHKFMCNFFLPSSFEIFFFSFV